MFTNFVNKFHRLDQTEIRRSWLLVSITCHPHVRKRRERETKNSIVCRNSDRSIINGGTHQPIQRVVSRSTCTSFYGSNNLQLCHRVELFLCGTRLFSSTLYASEIHFFFFFWLSPSRSLFTTQQFYLYFFSWREPRNRAGAKGNPSLSKFRDFSFVKRAPCLGLVKNWEKKPNIPGKHCQSRGNYSSFWIMDDG